MDLSSILRLNLLWRSGPLASAEARLGPPASSSGGHSLQRHEAADVVGEIGEADLRLRPDLSDGAHDPAARRGLLRPEHVLDASADLALLSVGRLLRLRQWAIAPRADMDAALEPVRLQLCLGRGRAIGAVGVDLD